MFLISIHLDQRIRRRAQKGWWETVFRSMVVIMICMIAAFGIAKILATPRVSVELVNVSVRPPEVFRTDLGYYGDSVGDFFEVSIDIQVINNGRWNIPAFVVLFEDIDEEAETFYNISLEFPNSLPRGATGELSVHYLFKESRLSPEEASHLISMAKLSVFSSYWIASMAEFLESFPVVRKLPEVLVNLIGVARTSYN